MEKESIAVCVRVRPPNKDEQLHNLCVRVNKEANQVILGKVTEQVYTFDHAYGPEAKQEEVFDAIGKPLTEACFAGYNATIFAYGQTGSGKSYTMLGGMNDRNEEIYEERGIAPRVLQHLFTLISEANTDSAGSGSTTTYTCRCTMLEIYNETISDLLNPYSKNLSLREDKQNGVYVDGLQEETVYTWDEAYRVLKRGTKERTTGETLMNKSSSRSHCVFTIDLQSKTTEASGLISYKRSKLNLVDLAGSERQSATSAQGLRLKEAGQINKSLSNLTSVMQSLVENSNGKNLYVRYRDSKLTYLLRDSLGGNSKTTIIAAVSPAMTSYFESNSTLGFAQQVKFIKNKAVINEEVSGNAAQFQAELKRVKEEFEAYKASVASGELPETSSSAITTAASTKKPKFSSQKEFEEEMERMELILVKIQERNRIIAQDRDSLKEKVDTLGKTKESNDNTIMQLKFALKLKDSMIQRIRGRGEIRMEDFDSLNQRINELSKIASDNAAFMKLKVENFNLRELETRLSTQPRDTQEWEQKVQGLNILIAEYGKRYEKLAKRYYAKRAGTTTTTTGMAGTITPVKEGSLTATPKRTGDEKSLSYTSNSACFTPMLKTFNETTKKELFVMSPMATPRRTQPADAGIQEKEKKIAELEAELEKLRNKANDLELELSATKEKLQKAEYEAKSAQETIKKLDMTAEELKSAVSVASGEKARLEDTIRENEVKASDTARLLKAKDEKIAELERLIDASDSDAKAQIDSIRMERDVALEEKANAEFNKIQTNAEITLLREENTRLTEQLGATKSQLDQIERKAAFERAESQKAIRQKDQLLLEKDEEINELLEAKRSLTNDLFKLQTDLTNKMSSSYIDDNDDDDDVGDLNLNDFGLGDFITTDDKSISTGNNNNNNDDDDMGL